MAISGYRSPLDLGLSQIPESSDPEVFNSMVEVYNAIHLLNQYLDQLRNSAGGGGGGSEQTPAESMPFVRFFTAIALQPLAAGDIISPSNISGQNGMVKGALAHDYTSTSPTSNFCAVALTDAGVGVEVRVGVGPASIILAGAFSGATLWAYSSRTTSGNLFGVGTLYPGNPGPATSGAGICYPMPVATCPVDGFALIGQYIAR